MTTQIETTLIEVTYIDGRSPVQQVNRAAEKSYKLCVPYKFICINQKHSINIIIDFLLVKLKKVAQLMFIFQTIATFKAISLQQPIFLVFGFILVRLMINRQTDSQLSTVQ